MGARVRQSLLETILSNNKVVLDFTGVDVVSNAFADECIAKLLMEMSLADLKEKTTFAGLNELAKMNIALALKRRQISMNRN